MNNDLAGAARLLLEDLDDVPSGRPAELIMAGERSLDGLSGRDGASNLGEPALLAAERLRGALQAQARIVLGRDPLATAALRAALREVVASGPAEPGGAVQRQALAA